MTLEPFRLTRDGVTFELRADEDRRVVRLEARVGSFAKIERSVPEADARALHAWLGRALGAGEGTV